jgi:hypothetical protein
VKRTACLWLLLAACGPTGGLWLRIEAPLRVPDQCDHLDVSVWRGPAQGAPLFQQSYLLDGGQQFPMTLALVTTDGANFDADGGMTASVAAELGTVLVASGSGATDLTQGQLSEIDLALP